MKDSLRPYLALIATLVGCDQVTKHWIDSTLRLHESRPVIDGLLSLTYVRNRGAAFGLLSTADLPHQAWVLTVLGLVALVAIGIYAWRLPSQERLARLALASILAGAIGNLICRVRFGYVIDFVDAYWGTHHWPAFNVADSAITVGVSLLVIDMLRVPRDARTPDGGLAPAPAGPTTED